MKIKGSHWNSVVGSFDPANYEGFIYYVVDRASNKFYIGKKQFHSTTRKKIPGRKNRKVIKKESNWREYISSSSYLKDAIKEKGLSSFEFYIVDLYKTRGGLTYAEAYYQFLLQVMTKKDSAGNRVAYNAQIAGIRFIPTEAPSDKSVARVKRLHKKLLAC